jgi:2-hydroxy-3-oxopropionate reductase
MGSAIGHRLIDTGHPLRVHDVRTEAMDAFAAEGAEIAATPQDLSRCAVVVLSLNTTALVDEVVFGPRGVLAQDASHLLIIDMSSITPTGSRDFAARAMIAAPAGSMRRCPAEHLRLLAASSR